MKTALIEQILGAIFIIIILKLIFKQHAPTIPKQGEEDKTYQPREIK